MFGVRLPSYLDSIAGSSETMNFVTFATNRDATTTFPRSTAGKTAVYRLRWIAHAGALGYGAKQR